MICMVQKQKRNSKYMIKQIKALYK